MIPPRIYFKTVTSTLAFMTFLMEIWLTSCENAPIHVDMQRLRSDLLKNYDKKLRPAKNQTIPTTVKLLYDVQNIVQLDEKNQILTVNGLLMMTWTDEHLVWKPEDYGGVKMIRFANHEIWQPDIYSLYNVKETDLYNDASSNLMMVHSVGDVRWYPRAIFDVPCSTKFRHYPFDKHNCTLLFGSWLHSGADIVLEALDLPLNAIDHAVTTEWILENVTHVSNIYRISDYFTYHTVTVLVYLQRASRIYKYICVIPTLISVVTTLTGFWLQASEPSRYLIGCSNVVMMSLLLQHLAVIVPAGSEIPLIAEYSAACLCMAASFLLVSVIVTIIGQSSSVPPTALVRLSRHSLDRFLCLSTFIPVPEGQNMTSVVTETERNMTSFDDAQRTKDWALVALVVDRLAFWVFVIVYVVLIAILASI